MLKTFQHLGYFKLKTEAPSNIVQYVARKVGIQIPSEKEWYSYSKSRTCYRHYSFKRKVYYHSGGDSFAGTTPDKAFIARFGSIATQTSN